MNFKFSSSRQLTTTLYHHMLLPLAQGGSSEPIGARLYYVDLQQREQWKTEPRHHQSDKSRRIDQFCVTYCVTFDEH